MKNNIKLILIAFGMIINWGCSDLNEDILDESLTGGTTDTDVIEGSIAPAYAPLPRFYRHTNYFSLQEITTDEAILPFRGGTDWGDNGIWIELHQHTYTPSHPPINDVWRSVTSGISRSVTAITALTPLVETDARARTFLAEARALRAFYSIKSLDLWGIVFVKEDAGELSTILRGNEAVNYIESELLAVEKDLSTSVGPGRITQAGARGLLARLYLNAAVWMDPYGTPNFTTENMDKVIEFCNMIISSGQYALSPEYFEIFGNDNHDNSELIFAIDQRPELNGHNRMSYFSLSGNLFPNPEFPRANGTDGPAITSDFYQTWVQAYGTDDPADMDARFFKENLIIPVDFCITAEEYKINRGIYRGQQYGLLTPSRGQPFERCDDGRYRITALRNLNRAAQSLVNHTELIDFTIAGSEYSSGYRVEKYEFSDVSDSGRNKGKADLVIVRLADIYMMRAEALMRKGDASRALADVNTVRTSRTARPETTPPTLTEMTLDILYRERGFEFYWEHQRRTDMIRFGKYEDTWTEKTDNNVQKRVFPIPQSAIDGASSTPDYLVQNPGY